MLRKHFQNVLKLAGYTVFAAFVFLISLFWVFPYQALSEHLVARAKQANIHLSIHSLKPSFLGVTAKGIQIHPEPSNPDSEVGPFLVDSLSFRLSPLRSKLIATLKMANGNIQLATGIFNQQNLSLQAKAIDLSRINFPALLWTLSPQAYSSEGVTPKLGLEGILKLAQFSLSLPPNQGAPEANGSWNIEMDGLLLKHGTLVMPWPGSPEPTRVDLPRVVFGSFKSAASIKKGLLQIAHTKTQSDELTCELFGNLQLAKKLAASETNFTLRLQAQPEFLGRLGGLRLVVDLLPVDPQDEQWRKAQWSGQLSNLTRK